MPGQNKVVKLHAEARAELQKSVAFYRSRAGERWANQFKQQVAEGLEAIAANPEALSTCAGAGRSPEIPD